DSRCAADADGPQAIIGSASSRRDARVTRGIMTSLRTSLLGRSAFLPAGIVVGGARAQLECIDHQRPGDSLRRSRSLHCVLLRTTRWTLRCRCERLRGFLKEKGVPEFIFQMQDLRKIVPPKREILKGIWLSFFYGAKIGVLGHNGAGKSTLLRIMA